MVNGQLVNGHITILVSRYRPGAVGEAAPPLSPPRGTCACVKWKPELLTDRDDRRVRGMRSADKFPSVDIVAACVVVGPLVMRNAYAITSRQTIAVTGCLYMTSVNSNGER